MAGGLPRSPSAAPSDTSDSSDDTVHTQDHNLTAPPTPLVANLTTMSTPQLSPYSDYHVLSSDDDSNDVHNFMFTPARRENAPRLSQDSPRTQNTEAASPTSSCHKRTAADADVSHLGKGSGERAAQRLRTASVDAAQVATNVNSEATHRHGTSSNALQAVNAPPTAQLVDVAPSLDILDKMGEAFDSHDHASLDRVQEPTGTNQNSTTASEAGFTIIGLTAGQRNGRSSRMTVAALSRRLSNFICEECGKANPFTATNCSNWCRSMPRPSLPSEVATVAPETKPWKCLVCDCYNSDAVEGCVSCNVQRRPVFKTAGEAQIALDRIHEMRAERQRRSAFDRLHEMRAERQRPSALRKAKKAKRTADEQAAHQSDEALGETRTSTCVQRGFHPGGSLSHPTSSPVPYSTCPVCGTRDSIISECHVCLAPVNDAPSVARRDAYAVMQTLWIAAGEPDARQGGQARDAAQDVRDTVDFGSAAVAPIEVVSQSEADDAIEGQDDFRLSVGGGSADEHPLLPQETARPLDNQRMGEGADEATNTDRTVAARLSSAPNYRAEDYCSPWAPSQGWACRSCTSRNSSTSESCNACGVGLRPFIPGQSDQRIPRWLCEQCGTETSVRTSECSFCQCQRPTQSRRQAQELPAVRWKCAPCRRWNRPSSYECAFCNAVPDLIHCVSCSGESHPSSQQCVWCLEPLPVMGDVRSVSWSCKRCQSENPPAEDDCKFCCSKPAHRQCEACGRMSHPSCASCVWCIEPFRPAECRGSGFDTARRQAAVSPVDVAGLVADPRFGATSPRQSTGPSAAHGASQTSPASEALRRGPSGKATRWFCNNCSSPNFESAHTCSKCRTARREPQAPPSPAASPSPAVIEPVDAADQPMPGGWRDSNATDEDYWACPSCDVRNGYMRNYCHGCAVRRPGVQPDILEPPVHPPPFRPSGISCARPSGTLEASLVLNPLRVICPPEPGWKWLPKTKVRFEDEDEGSNENEGNDQAMCTNEVDRKGKGKAAATDGDTEMSSENCGDDVESHGDATNLAIGTLRRENERLKASLSETSNHLAAVTLEMKEITERCISEHSAQRDMLAAREYNRTAQLLGLTLKSVPRFDGIAPPLPHLVEITQPSHLADMGLQQLHSWLWFYTDDYDLRITDMARARHALRGYLGLQEEAWDAPTQAGNAPWPPPELIAQNRQHQQEHRDRGPPYGPAASFPARIAREGEARDDDDFAHRAVLKRWEHLEMEQTDQPTVSLTEQVGSTRDDALEEDECISEGIPSNIDDIEMSDPGVSDDDTDEGIPDSAFLWASSAAASVKQEPQAATAMAANAGDSATSLTLLQPASEVPPLPLKQAEASTSQPPRTAHDTTFVRDATPSTAGPSTGRRISPPQLQRIPSDDWDHLSNDSQSFEEDAEYLAVLAASAREANQKEYNDLQAALRASAAGEQEENSDDEMVIL